MGFKNIKPKEIVLILIAMVCLVFFLGKHLIGQKKDTQVVQEPIEKQQNNITGTSALKNSVLENVIKEPVIEEGDENERINIKEMHDQMDKERDQQKQIKLLNLKIEQARLQNELEKQISETSKLRKDNTGIVKDSSVNNDSHLPDIKLLFIGITAAQREALIAINGTNYSVKEKDHPIDSVEIVKITEKNVQVKFHTNGNTDQDYTFKLE